MPDWLQEIAALTTVVLAAVWLLVRWFEIGKPRASSPGCARCDHNVLVPNAGREPTHGVRSARLRVID